MNSLYTFISSTFQFIKGEGVELWGRFLLDGEDANFMQLPEQLSDRLLDLPKEPMEAATPIEFELSDGRALSSLAINIPRTSGLPGTSGALVSLARLAAELDIKEGGLLVLQIPQAHDPGNRIRVHFISQASRLPGIALQGRARWMRWVGCRSTLG